MRDLTERQAEILAFIRNEVRTKGRPPSMREIGKEFGIRSTNGVSDHLWALEKKGFIRRLKGQRNIAIVETVAVGTQPCCPSCGQALHPKEAA